MKTCLLLLLVSQYSWATLWYSDQEIEAFLSQKSFQEQELLPLMLTSHDPNQSLKQWMTSAQDPLNREYQLFQLLDHWANHPPDAHFDAALKQLTKYQSVTTRSYLHAGPEHHQYIFPIASKAHGVENIWLAHRSQLKAAQIIAKHNDPWHGLSDMLSSDLRPINFAVKQAISQAPVNQREVLADSLLSQKQWPEQSADAIAHLVTLQNNSALTEKALETLPKMAAERVFRHLAQQPDSESISLMIQADKTQADRNFITSLLSPHQDQPGVVDHLLKQLSNPKSASGAAFALKQNKSPKVRQRLLQMKQAKPQGALNQHIDFILNVNPTTEQES